MNQLGNMTFVTNVIRNTGQLVVFGTAKSLSYLAHGKGIFIMIVMLYQFWWLMKNLISFCQVFLPKMSNMSIQSESKEVVDEENDNPTSNNNSERGDALDTILKSQLEIINSVTKDITS